jgi:two-component system, OmpR family, alkaline phosphatase synthesis response regulator PhoP
MPRVLIAEDEPSIVLAVQDELRFEGFEVFAVDNGPAAVSQALALRPDVLLLDLMLPAMNGFAVCRELRPKMPELWIIMLTVRGQEADRVTGFEAGADDYVTKPFSLRELVARVKVGLRRRQGHESAPVRTLGDVEIDLKGRRVHRGGEDIALTRREFDILELLLRRPGEVITRDEFLDALWGKDVYVTNRTVDTHVAALRKKLEGESVTRPYICSVRGLGYRLDENLLKS